MEIAINNFFVTSEVEEDECSTDIFISSRRNPSLRIAALSRISIRCSKK